MENKTHPQFIVVDLFCGAGGTSKGFDRAKYKGLNVAEVIACVNHDKQAIRNHSLNFPRCVHFTEDVRNMDFGMLKAVVRYYRRKYPNAKLILWASLECTHFSNAKTGSRSADSRTLAWILYEYQQKLQPDMIMVENVREFMSWGPLSAKVVKAKGEIGDHCQLTYNRKKKTLSGVWVPEKRKNGIDYLKWRQTIESRGYRYASRLLNSADFGSFQSRLRYFCVFARPGLPIVFPTPTHDKKGRHGLPKWNPVRKVLDLDEIGVSIFTKEQKQQYGLYLGDEQSQAQCRAKPLSPNTHKRVLAGLVKFVANGEQAYMVKNYGGDPTSKVQSLENPSGTITCVPHEMIINTQYIIRSNGGDPKDRVASLEDPTNTLTTAPNQQFVTVGFLGQYNGCGGNAENAVSSIDDPCRTLTTTERFALYRVVPWIDNRTINGRPSSVDTAAPTLVTEPTQRLVQAVFIDHANRNGEPTDIERPANTLVTEPRQSVVSAVFMDNQFGHGGEDRGATSLENPSGTIATVPKKVLIHAAFLDRQFGKSTGASLDEPCGTIPTEPKTNVVSAQFLMPTNYNNEPVSMDEPAPTLTADRHWPYVVHPAFLMTNMHQNSGTGLEQPAPTILTGTHHYLVNPQYNNAGVNIDNPCCTLIAKMDKMPLSLVTVQPANPGQPELVYVDPAFFKDESIDVVTRIVVFMTLYGISDIFMRMLNIGELKRIQGLDIKAEEGEQQEKPYILKGAKATQKKHIGNAVEPRVVTAWIQDYYLELNGLTQPPAPLQLFAA